MPKEQEYVTIETTIRKTPFGTESTDKLVAKASKISETFKEELWEDYSINLDDLKIDDLKDEQIEILKY